jgi:hypothetical protein
MLQKLSKAFVYVRTGRTQSRQQISKGWKVRFRNAGGGGGVQEIFLSTHVHTDPGTYTASPTVGMKSISSAINRPSLGFQTHTHTHTHTHLAFLASSLRNGGAYTSAGRVAESPYFTFRVDAHVFQCKVKLTFHSLTPSF